MGSLTQVLKYSVLSEKSTHPKMGPIPGVSRLPPLLMQTIYETFFIISQIITNVKKKIGRPAFRGKR